MSERMTQEVLRGWRVHLKGPEHSCSVCSARWFRGDPEEHWLGGNCPCAPANVTVSREDLSAALEALAWWTWGSSVPRDYVMRLRAALGEEPTP